MRLSVNLRLVPKRDFTDGAKCAVCGKILVAQREIPILDHVDDDDDYICDICGSRISMTLSEKMRNIMNDIERLIIHILDFLRSLFQR